MSCNLRRAKSTDILAYISSESPIFKTLVPFHHLDAHLTSDSSDTGRLADTRRTGQKQYALRDKIYQTTCKIHVGEKDALHGTSSLARLPAC
jgi:hypothetical protein